MNFADFVKRLDAYFAANENDNPHALALRSDLSKHTVAKWFGEDAVQSARHETIRKVCELGLGTTYEEFMASEVDPVLQEIRADLMKLEPLDRQRIRDQIRGILLARGLDTSE